MLNILIGILVWQLVTSIVAMKADNIETIARVGCGIWWLLWQFVLIVKETLKK